MTVEYRITGKFRKDDKRHVVDSNRKWTLADAKRRLEEVQRQVEWEIKHRKCKPTNCGMIGITTEYYSDYDLLELRIESREIIPWNIVENN